MSSEKTPLLKCGTVAVIGAANAGKSTLVNGLVGEKVSIVSPKVQTTRNRVMGIAIRKNADYAAQIILVDTPGIFAPKSRLDTAMVGAAWSGAEESDMIAYLFDAKKKGPNDGDLKAIERLAPLVKNRPVFLILNKIDQIQKPKLLALTVRLNELCPFTATYMISALNGDGVEDVAKGLIKSIPAGDWIYDEDQTTDMPMRLLAAEITREQIFRQLHDEVPYEITVETEKWEDFGNGDIRISQIIHVTRDHLKSIILGKGGTRLQQIGARARAELEEMTGTKVHLKLFVRVSEKWKDDPDYYAQWGLEI